MSCLLNHTYFFAQVMKVRAQRWASAVNTGAAPFANPLYQPPPCPFSRAELGQRPHFCPCAIRNLPAHVVQSSMWLPGGWPTRKSQDQWEATDPLQTSVVSWSLWDVEVNWGAQCSVPKSGRGGHREKVRLVLPESCSSKSWGVPLMAHFFLSYVNNLLVPCWATRGRQE